MDYKIKKFNQIEYTVKGFSNKKRIEILFLLEQEPELSVSKISKNIKLSFKSTSKHLLKMMSSGLIMKRNSGSEIKHALTEKGKIILQLLKKI